MATQETYHSTVAVADPELARRRAPSQSSSSSKRDLTPDEKKEHEEIEHIMDARERYAKDRKAKEHEWTESFKMYMSWVDKVIAPFMSNLFIPKTHEAVELLAAFLIGSNQSITATAEPGGLNNTMKAKIAGRFLDKIWRKGVKARLKILVWIKQGIVFGNGYMKVGWDNAKNRAWMGVCAIEDVYVDYFEPDEQESEYLIHEIRRNKKDVESDEKYDLKDSEGNFIRSLAIEGGAPFANEAEALFNTYDKSFNRSECKGKVLVMEVWCLGKGGEKQMIKTLIPTSLGWRVARRAENPNAYKDGTQFRPFVKLRFKSSPIPNRAYDTGMVWPTVGLQKSFNDLMNEYFDAVAIINSPMWIKRRGARINPMEMIRRPGGIITVSDINKDLKWETIGDVKQSIIEMLNRLDREFQEASMVVNLLKGISSAETATGDALAQQNVQQLLDMIDQNVEDALSEVGQMLLSISLKNTDEKQVIELYETDSEVASIEFDPKDIDGMHDVWIIPDREARQNKAVQNKQLIDFIKLLLGDQETQQRYPSIKSKIYKRFLENGGVGDADHFFEEQGPTRSPLQLAPGGAPGGAPQVRLPGSGEGMSEAAIREGAQRVIA